MCPVPRKDDLDPELVELICLTLGIDVPGDIITRLNDLRDQAE